MIAIKDMKIPKSCKECNFCIQEEGWGEYCSANQKILGLFSLDKRSKHCPLREVK